MPTYEYKCDSCTHQFEVFARMSDPDPEVCEACGSNTLNKILFPVAVHYKGSGFYSTDYSGSKVGGSSDSGSSESGSSESSKGASESGGDSSGSSDSGSSSSDSGSSSGGSGSGDSGGAAKPKTPPAKGSGSSSNDG